MSGRACYPSWSGDKAYYSVGVAEVVAPRPEKPSYDYVSRQGCLAIGRKRLLSRQRCLKIRPVSTFQGEIGPISNGWALMMALWIIQGGNDGHSEQRA